MKKCKKTMTTLRKKIFYFKIQNIIARNNFVLFFQFNNIKFKEWVLLRNQILSLQNTSMIVIKNNITYQMLDDYMFRFKLDLNKKCKEKTKFFQSVINSKVKFLSKSNQINDLTNLHKKNLNSIYKNKFVKTNSNNVNNVIINEKSALYLADNKKQLCFLCQGPTLLLAFNSIQQCKIIYEILNSFTYNLSNKFIKHQLKFKKTIFNSHEHKFNLSENKKLPSIFKKNMLSLDSQKYNLLNQNNEKLNLFFIGGLVENKIINHLDFEKLSNLDNTVYVHLIYQCYNKIIWFLLLKTILKIKLIKCFHNNLINLLFLYKNDIKKN